MERRKSGRGARNLRRQLQLQFRSSLAIVATMFRCCTCKKELPDEDQGALGSLPKIGLFTSGLFFGKMWVRPTKVCKDCVECTARTGELGFCVTAAVVVLILIGIILGLSR